MEGIITLGVLGAGIVIAVALSYASMNVVLSLLPGKTPEK